MNVDIQLINKNAKIPTQGSEYAAGFDLYACADTDSNLIHILPHTTQKVKTGIAMSIPDGYFGGIYARSSLATKQGLRPANCVGVIDSDYRGEIIVALYNDTNETKTITEGERIAQLIIQPYLTCSFTSVEKLDETNRGDGGFGSTGK